MGKAVYSFVKKGMNPQSLGKVESKCTLVRDFSPTPSCAHPLGRDSVAVNPVPGAWHRTDTQ